jgi:DNA-binding protein HU-beta
MTKPELVTRIAENANITKKKADLALHSIVSVIHEALGQKNGRIRISDLGTFRVLDLKPRKGVNPRTGKSMTIPAMKVPRFSPSNALKEIVQKKRK